MAKKNVAKDSGSIGEAWAALFIENERLAAGKSTKPMTDDEIVALMEDAFPDRKGKTTTTRTTMYRYQYNRGDWTFKQLGEPDGSAAHPVSHRYDAEGNRVERGNGKPVKAKPKQAGGKKKKTTRKKARRRVAGKDPTGGEIDPRKQAVHD